MNGFLPKDARARGIVLGAGVLALTLVFTQFVLPGRGSGRGTPAAVLFQGLVLGLCYSVFTTGMVLVYRAIRIVNFAQGPIGLVGGSLMFGLIRYTSVPFPIALLLGMALSGLVGAIIGLFMLRFFNASRLYLTVITIVATFPLTGPVLAAVASAPFLPSTAEQQAEGALSIEGLRALLPLPGLHFGVGSFPLRFGFSELFGIELAIVTLLVVALFLRYTRTGVAMRALAENPERASLLGIGVGGLSILVWVIAGVLDNIGITMTFIGAANPGGGFTVLLPFFVAAVIARFHSLPVAWTVCMVLGVVKSAWFFSLGKDTDLFFVALFGALCIALLLQRRTSGRSESAEVSWAGSTEPRPIPKELSGITSLRLARYGIYAAGLLLVGVLPFVLSLDRTVLLTFVFINAIAVVSLVVLTGWAGQVSLGQYAFVAVGAVVAGSLTSKVGVPFWFAVPIAAAITGVVAVIVGLPALRLKGLLLLVSTFGFAVALRFVLFQERYFGWLLPKGVDRPSLFFFNFEEERSMYFLAVAAFVAACVVVTNLRRSRTGRLLIALRENENNVAAFGVSVVRTKLLAIAIAGSMAGFAGALLCFQQRGVTADSFSAEANVIIFTSAVIGGVGSVGGAIIGSAYSVLVNQFLGNNVIVQQFVAGFGPIAIVLLAPGGLMSLVNMGRDSVLRVVAQRRRIVVPSLFADYDPEALERQLIPLGDQDPLSGLAAVPVDERYALESELYAGRGERIIDKLGPPKPDRETAAIGAAARSALEFEYETAAVGPGPETP
jgi:branched-chain amino acid transport system permease protein